ALHPRRQRTAHGRPEAVAPATDAWAAAAVGALDCVKRGTLEPGGHFDTLLSVSHCHTSLELRASRYTCPCCSTSRWNSFCASDWTPLAALHSIQSGTCASSVVRPQHFVFDHPRTSGAGRAPHPGKYSCTGIASKSAMPGLPARNTRLRPSCSKTCVPVLFRIHQMWCAVSRSVTALSTQDSGVARFIAPPRTAPLVQGSRDRLSCARTVAILRRENTIQGSLRQPVPR